MSTVSEIQPYLNPAEIARRYGFGRDVVYRWMSDGVTVAGRTIRLTGVRIGGSWRVSPEAWEAFLVACNPGQPLPSTAEQSAAALAAKKSVRKRLGMD